MLSWIVMTREVVLGNQIIVVARDGRFHIADISDVVEPLLDRESIRPALTAYFEKYGLRIATADEAERHGFPVRRERRTLYHHTLPKPQRHR